jgi:transcription initiation factor TFIIB
VGSIAGLGERTKREAIKIMSLIKVSEYGTGKKPMGIAATVLYVACCKTGKLRTQKEISADVTEVTLRTRLRDMKAKQLV